MLTLRQYADQQRRVYITENEGITLAEMRREQSDSWYRESYHAYVAGLVKTTTLTARQLDNYYRTFGGNELRLLLKFNPDCAPLYYVHPDFRIN